MMLGGAPEVPEVLGELGAETPELRLEGEDPAPAAERDSVAEAAPESD